MWKASKVILLNQLLYLFPKPVLAFIAIAIGVLIIFIFNPPYDKCKIPIESFKESQQGFLYDKPTKLSSSPATYSKLYKNCKAANNPGGCFTLFDQLQKMLRASDMVPIECTKKLASVGALSRTIWESLELTVRLAWGDKPPDSYVQRLSWLSRQEVQTFCMLKQEAIDIYGSSRWEGFREKMLKALPGAEKLSRKEVWERILLSISCNNYLSS